RGAFARGGDGDLEVAARDDGAEIEVAVGRVVNGIAEDVSLNGGVVNGGVYGRVVGCGNDEEGVVEIVGRKGALFEGDGSGSGESGDFRMDARGDDADAGFGGEQGLNLLRSHGPR